MFLKINKKGFFAPLSCRNDSSYTKAQTPARKLTKTEAFSSDKTTLCARRLNYMSVSFCGKRQKPLRRWWLSFITAFGRKEEKKKPPPHYCKQSIIQRRMPYPVMWRRSCRLCPLSPSLTVLVFHQMRLFAVVMVKAKSAPFRCLRTTVYACDLVIVHWWRRDHC